MAQREGAALLLGGMSPAELVAKRKTKAPGAPAPMPEAPADDTEDSNVAAVSALHQLAGALGVSVKDEDAGVQAMQDLVKACSSYGSDE